jgi:cell division protein FtsB
MKKKRALLLILPVALFTGALFFLFGRQGIYYQHRELVRRNAEIVLHRRTIDSLNDVINKLTNDTAYIERIARENLGMARKNEKVYKFIEKRK